MSHFDFAASKNEQLVALLGTIENYIMASITLKKTKNVIFTAYKELLAENQRLKSELRLSGSTAAPKTITKTVVKEVYKTPSPEEMESLISMLEAVEGGIGKAAAKFSAKQVVEAEALEAVQTQIKEGKDQLKDLYDIEMEDGSVDTIIDEYEALKDGFSKDFEAKKKDFNESYSGKVKEWKEERENYAEETREKKEQVALEQKREKAEHTYQLNQERALEKDTYNQKTKALQQELAELKEVKEEEMAATEKAMAEREEEFADYQSKYEELPAKKEAAIKKAEEEAIGIIKREAKIKASLLAKEMEAKKRANDFRISNLQKTIDKQEAQINKMSAQLEKALQQAQSLAIKALEGSANSESFDAIKAIAMEQAKFSSKK